MSPWAANHAFCRRALDSGKCVNNNQRKAKSVRVTCILKIDCKRKLYRTQNSISSLIRHPTQPIAIHAHCYAHKWTHFWMENACDSGEHIMKKCPTHWISKRYHAAVPQLFQLLLGIYNFEILHFTRPVARLWTQENQFRIRSKFNIDAIAWLHYILNINHRPV